MLKEKNKVRLDNVLYVRISSNAEKRLKQSMKRLGFKKKSRFVDFMLNNVELITDEKTVA